MRSITLKNMLKISRMCNTYRRNELKDTDLNPAVHIYISYVCRHPGCKQEVFVEQFSLDKTTVTHQLNHLEKHGYIYRMVSEQDGRCRLIYPTEKAKQTYPVIHQAIECFTGTLLSGLTEEEKKLLDQLTTKLAKNAEGLIKE